LIGPIAGASSSTAPRAVHTAFPEFWLFFLGLLFILVTLFLPRGVNVGGLLSWRRERPSSGV
jgi:urea transport system permease protein